MKKLSFQVIEIADTGKASICAIIDGQVYEHPTKCDIPEGDARKILDEMLAKGEPPLEEIKSSWTCLG